MDRCCRMSQVTTLSSLYCWKKFRIIGDGIFVFRTRVQNKQHQEHIKSSTHPLRTLPDQTTTVRWRSILFRHCSRCRVSSHRVIVPSCPWLTDGAVRPCKQIIPQLERGTLQHLGSMRQRGESTQVRPVWVTKQSHVTKELLLSSRALA